MSIKRRTYLFGMGVMLAGAVTLAGCTSSSTSNTAALDVIDPKVKRNGEIYLFRGLANVFSLGMDEIQEKMVAKGLNATVQNHSTWRPIADDIVSRSKLNRVNYPVIIMGHSLGGNATIQMAKYLGDRGVKVAYAVSFDPTITNFVGPNIGEVINYYLPNSDHSNIVKEASGFTGSLRNFDVSQIEGITHVTVEKSSRFQSNVINTSLKYTKAKRSRGVSQVADVDQP